MIMRNHSLLITCFVVFLLTSFSFLKFDKERSEYGLPSVFYSRQMPYGLSVSKESYSSYALLDEDGYELAGIGFRYGMTDFKMKDLLACAYNDSSVVLKCTDDSDSIRFLSSYETGYKSKKGNPEISFMDFKNYNLAQIDKDYNWIIFDEEKANKASSFRLLSLIGVVFSFLLFGYRLGTLLRAPNRQTAK
jgi:hypothetical protein